MKKKSMTNYLMMGDPMDPTDTDIIAQTMTIAVGERVPDGWRVLTGNARYSMIARVALRYEIDGE